MRSIAGRSNMMPVFIAASILVCLLPLGFIFLQPDEKSVSMDKQDLALPVRSELVNDVQTPELVAEQVNSEIAVALDRKVKKMVGENFELSGSERVFDEANSALAAEKTEKALGLYNKILTMIPAEAAERQNWRIASMICDRPKYTSLVYLQRGNCYAALKQYKAAIADMTQAIRLRPGLSLYYKRRGEIYSEMGEIKLAETDKAAAIALGIKRPGKKIIH